MTYNYINSIILVMKKIKIFISSVQKEFANERKELREPQFIQEDMFRTILFRKQRDLNTH